MWEGSTAGDKLWMPISAKDAPKVFINHEKWLRTVWNRLRILHKSCFKGCSCFFFESMMPK